MNFRHRVPQMLELFIFPSQTTQVFWSDEMQKPGWKVVLAKEARCQRHDQSTQDVFMTTTKKTDGMQLPPPPTTTSLVGAIKLSDSVNSLVLAKF